MLSKPDGRVQTTVTAQGVGKVSFAPAFVDTYTTSLEPAGGPEGVGHVGAGLAPARADRPIPRYQSVARKPFAVTALYGDGSIGLATGGYQRLPVERRHARKEMQSAPRRAAGQKLALTQPNRQGLPTLASPQTRIAHSQDPALDLEPLDASTAVPLPEVKQAAMSARAMEITS